MAISVYDRNLLEADMKNMIRALAVALPLIVASTYAASTLAQFGSLMKDSPFAKKGKDEVKEEDTGVENGEDEAKAGGTGGLGGMMSGLMGGVGGAPSTAASDSSGNSNLSGALGLIGTAVASQTDEEEIVAGDAVAAMYLGVAPLISDQKTLAYVNAVGRRVASKSSRPDLPWSFGIIDTPSINAFAAPGGKVLVTAGLFEILETEDELAAVLGHEIAHVARKHHWDLIKQQKLVSGVTDMVSSNTDTGGGLAEAAFGQMASFFKDMATSGIDKGGEYQADMDGIILAANAGYDSTAMLGVLEKLSAESGSGGDVSLLYSTHPTAEQRTDRVLLSFSPDLEAAATPSRYSVRITSYQGS
jgi:beta-barrel assembly-enhancing protease